MEFKGMQNSEWIYSNRMRIVVPTDRGNRI